MIKCCIFDLDGTILDTITTITHFVNLTHDKFGVERVTVDECKYFAGNGARKLIERSSASRGVTDKEKQREMLEYYMQTYDSEPLYLTEPFEGITDMLIALKNLGVKLAVLSNKPDFASKSVVEKFFPGIFDITLGGREGVPLKPDPTAPREIIDSLGVTSEETAWIGDTATDMETGKNLGAKINFGCLWGFRQRDELESAGADFIVSTPDEIYEEILKNV